jgi:hypothetical protein
LPDLSNVSLSIRLLLQGLLIFLVALLVLLFLIIMFIFPLILALGNEISIVATIVAHSLGSCSLLLVSIESPSLAYVLVELLDE